MTKIFWYINLASVY